MNNLQQLIKKDKSLVYPKTFLDAIKSRETGQTLDEILQGFNMYFVSYNGNILLSRCLVPIELRKRGLWITYINFQNEVITEWYDANEVSNEAWGNSKNWRIASNRLIGDISISSNGNWIVNGKELNAKAKGDKGETPILRYNNLILEVTYNYGRKWEKVTEFENNLHIKGYVSREQDLPNDAILGSIYMVGPTYKEDDLEHENPYYRMWVKNNDAWKDNGEFTSITAGITQSITNSPITVPSNLAIYNDVIIKKCYKDTALHFIIPGVSFVWTHENPKIGDFTYSDSNLTRVNGSILKEVTNGILVLYAEGNSSVIYIADRRPYNDIIKLYKDENLSEEVDKSSSFVYQDITPTGNYDTFIWDGNKFALLKYKFGGKTSIGNSTKLLIVLNPDQSLLSLIKRRENTIFEVRNDFSIGKVINLEIEVKNPITVSNSIDSIVYGTDYTLYTETSNFIEIDDSIKISYPIMNSTGELVMTDFYLVPYIIPANKAVKVENAGDIFLHNGTGYTLVSRIRLNLSDTPLNIFIASRTPGKYLCEVCDYFFYTIDSPISINKNSIVTLNTHSVREEENIYLLNLNKQVVASPTEETLLYEWVCPNDGLYYVASKKYVDHGFRILVKLPYYSSEAIYLLPEQAIHVPYNCAILNNNIIYKDIYYNTSNTDTTCFVVSLKDYNSIDIRIDSFIRIFSDCIIKFNGGTISNGTIVGTNLDTLLNKAGQYPVILSDIIKIFNNTIIAGVWNSDTVYPEWWGAVKNVETISCDLALNCMFSSVKISNLYNVNFLKGTYFIDKEILIADTPCNIYGPDAWIKVIHVRDSDGKWHSILHEGSTILNYNKPKDHYGFKFLLEESTSTSTEVCLNFSITGCPIGVIGVTNFYMHDCQVGSTNPSFLKSPTYYPTWFGISLSNVTNAEFKRIYLNQFTDGRYGNTNSCDGIHLYGGCKNILIDKCYGLTGDDFVAINAYEYSPSDIEGVTIRDCLIGTEINPSVSGIRIYGGTRDGVSANISNVSISNCKFHLTGHPAVYFTNKSHAFGDTSMDKLKIHGFNISNCEIYCPLYIEYNYVNNPACINIVGTDIDNLVIDNVNGNANKVNASSLLRVDLYCDIGMLNIRSSVFNGLGRNDDAMIVIEENTNIGVLSIENSTVKSSSFTISKSVPQYFKYSYYDGSSFYEN